jgi:hypothetical protein
MASKKRSTTHPKVKKKAASVAVARAAKASAKTTSSTTDAPDRVAVQPENTAPDAYLSNEQRARMGTLLQQAERVLENVEDRMMALTIAATARWSPGQDVHEVEENEAPAFGDDEFDEFLALVEDTAELAMFQGVALFLGLPKDVVDQAVSTTLVEGMSSGPQTKRRVDPAALVVHQRQRRPGPR